MNHVVIETAPELGTLKVFNPDGVCLFMAPCRNDAIGGDGYGHDARCPLGEYALGAPEPNNPPIISEGAWFVPLLDVNGLWDAEGRSAIGIHGGGSASPTPLAGDQGFYPTEGCFRLLNDDLGAFVPHVSRGARLSVTKLPDTNSTTKGES